jgi:hypothetical protein
MLISKKSYHSDKMLSKKAKIWKNVFSEIVFEIFSNY